MTKSELYQYYRRSIEEDIATHYSLKNISKLTKSVSPFRWSVDWNELDDKVGKEPESNELGEVSP